MQRRPTGWPSTLSMRTAVSTFSPANAGLASYPRAALETSEADFDRVFAVNVKGVWLCARSVIPAMRAAGGGSIIVTGSVMGERTRPGFSAYAPSKAAANHLSRTLAVELAPEGIRVNAVAPVATDTGMLPMFLGPDHPEEAREAFIAGIPMGRLAQPADVADATVFRRGSSHGGHFHRGRPVHRRPLR
ncbi:SDR family oxidoreductase [Streptomyces sp. NPDC056373]|uniref:SDR family oxidoreductase n=1 Tax=Streptomyces sp. NPDC056373 TaxID=3345798 RepID=UPI0035DDDBEF